MSILFVNACVREDSRTLLLAEDYLKKCTGPVEELCLETAGLQPLNRALLAERDRLTAAEAWDAPYFAPARQFAGADEIVIAAPFWDLGFPALLKIYLENITVAGITFCYEHHVPKGLCRAKKLTFVTTSGGPIFADFGYPYLKALATGFYGIPEVRCLRAENLDGAHITRETLFEKAEIKVLD